MRCLVDRHPDRVKSLAIMLRDAGCCCRAIKTMLAESCDANTQARGMAYLNLGWGMGNIVGKLHAWVSFNHLIEVAIRGPCWF